MIGYFSKSIGKIPYLESFLGSECRWIGISHLFRKPEVVVGWGLKKTADKARRYASKNGIDYWHLEDGFLRSVQLGLDTALRHSLIVDKTGIYYDATRPSDCEQLILKSSLSESQLVRSRDCIDKIRSNRLSKYNHAPDKKLSGTNKVLVVDQTVGDASIQYGMATDRNFIDMLHAAISENPDSEVIVKIHPDVIKGKKKGHLLKVSNALGCTVFTEDINPWSILDIVDRVYVVTSQLGFEGLLAGKKVTCFGMPFYAGWGLTDDRQTCERRQVERSLEQVFHAAYIQYPRYINPFNGMHCELEDTIKLIAEQKMKSDY